MIFDTLQGGRNLFVETTHDEKMKFIRDNKAHFICGL